MRLCKICSVEVSPTRMYCSNICKFKDPVYNATRGRKKAVIPKEFQCQLCNWQSNDIANKSGVLLKHFTKIHDYSVDDFYDKFPSIVRSARHTRKTIQLTSNIVCAICNEPLHKITNTHVKNHGMTVEEYKSIYNSPTVSIQTKNKQSIASISTQISNIFNGTRLGESIIPMFTAEQYNGVEGRTKYPFRCDVCKYEFMDHLDDGNIPTCGVCNPAKAFSPTGKAQTEVFEFIKSIYDGNIIQNCRTIIGPKELDIVVPDLQLAIEYNGLFWHSERYLPRRYHADKMELANAKGYRIIQIFEDEWESKKDIVKSKLQYLLNKTEHTLYARNTEIRNVLPTDARIFLEENHLQGADSHFIAHGLYHNNVLMAIATYTKPRVALGYRKNKNHIELSRFCVSKFTNIVGGFAKLLAHFKKTQTAPVILISYADLRYVDSATNIYKNNGFTETKRTVLGYWYFSNGKKRLHRFNLTKQVLATKYNATGTTEYEMAKQAGFDRIWDCGHLKYELIIT